MTTVNDEIDRVLGRLLSKKADGFRPEEVEVRVQTNFGEHFDDVLISFGRTGFRRRIMERAKRLSIEGLKPLNLNAYYYGFENTGVYAVDKILAEVASAGKRYHHTEEWHEDDDVHIYSCEQMI